MYNRNLRELTTTTNKPGPLLCPSKRLCPRLFLTSTLHPHLSMAQAQSSLTTFFLSLSICQETPAVPSKYIQTIFTSPHIHPYHPAQSPVISCRITTKALLVCLPPSPAAPTQCKRNQQPEEFLWNQVISCHSFGQSLQRLQRIKMETLQLGSSTYKSSGEDGESNPQSSNPTSSTTRVTRFGGSGCPSGCLLSSWPMGSKVLFKSSWRRKDCLLHPDVSQRTQKRICHFLGHHPLQGGIRWRRSQYHPRSTFQTRRIHSWFRGPPNEAHLFVWNEDTQDSFWEMGTSHHTHLHPSHSLLFEAPSQSNHGFISLLFLVGKVLNILKSWAESVLSPFKPTPLCRWDKSEMAATAKPAPRGKSGPWERVCTEERVPLLVVNFSFSWRPFESLSLTHGCLNKFN